MRKCNGTMINTPGKRFARCSTCGAIEYEANEGDACRERCRWEQTAVWQLQHGDNGADHPQKADTRAHQSSLDRRGQ